MQPKGNESLQAHEFLSHWTGGASDDESIMSALYVAQMFNRFCNGCNMTNVCYEPHNLSVKLNFLIYPV